MTEQPPLYGLLLAGGRSRRMGRDKALIETGGKSQLERAMQLLATVTDKSFVSVRGDQVDDPARSRYPTIVDRYADAGPVAGILSALDEYPNVDWLVLACDLPNLDAPTLAALIAERETSRAFVAFTSSHDGLPEPLCAIYRQGSGDVLRRFVNDGLRCPRKMLIRSDTKLLTQPNPRALDNVNTPQDLAALAS